MPLNDPLKGYSDIFERKLCVLHELSNAVVVTDSISALANLMLDLALNHTGAEKGSLMLLNETDELSIVAARGMDVRVVRDCKVKVGEGIAGAVAGSRSPVLVESLESDGRFGGGRKERHYRTKSFISCPVVSKSRLLGVLNITDKGDGASFTENELALARLIAGQAAISLENAVLMNQLKRKAAELEEINSRLIEADSNKTELLTRLSHELRTPLNSITGAIYYLRHTEKMNKAEQVEFYDIISRETGKLVTTVEDLLDFLRGKKN